MALHKCSTCPLSSLLGSVPLQTVQNNLRMQCRCHGLTGSCNVKTCWLSLPDFDGVGAMLIKKYDNAVKVQKSVSSGELVSVDSRALPLEENDLVFIEEPPSYCEEDVR